MLVRLLVAVLVAAGPMPVRLCTCAAAQAPSVPTGSPAPGFTPETGNRCGCGHRSQTSEGAAVDADTAHGLPHVDQPADTPSHPDRHDRDCPAVNPRPVVSAAVPTPAAEPPADLGVGVPGWVESETARPHAAPRPHTQSEGRAVPLYLSLLSLRI